MRDVSLDIWLSVNFSWPNNLWISNFVTWNIGTKWNEYRNWLWNNMNNYFYSYLNPCNRYIKSFKNKIWFFHEFLFTFSSFNLQIKHYYIFFCCAFECLLLFKSFQNMILFDIEFRFPTSPFLLSTKSPSKKKEALLSLEFKIFFRFLKVPWNLFFLTT